MLQTSPSAQPNLLYADCSRNTENLKVANSLPILAQDKAESLLSLFMKNLAMHKMPFVTCTIMNSTVAALTLNCPKEANLVHQLPANIWEKSRYVDMEFPEVTVVPVQETSVEDLLTAITLLLGACLHVTRQGDLVVHLMIIMVLLTL